MTPIPKSRRRLRHTHKAPQILYFMSLVSTAVSQVSLSSFSPYAVNLSPSCESVYTETILGCTVGDFDSTVTCSSACLAGLVQISSQVYNSCGSTQDYQLLIAEFLNGQGIEVLCPGVVVVTAAPSPSAIPSPTHFNQQSTAVESRRTSESVTTTTKSKPQVTTGTSVLSSGSFPTNSLVHDTQSPPCVYSTCTDTSTGPVETSQRVSTRHHHTMPATAITSDTTRTSSITSKTTSSRSSRSHSTTHSSAPSSSPTINVAAAAESKCIEFGGDAFSNCPGGYTHNAAPASLRTSLAWLMLLSGTTAASFYFVVA